MRLPAISTKEFLEYMKGTLTDAYAENMETPKNVIFLESPISILF